MNRRELFGLTVESGILCMEVRDFHAMAEELLGRPIWSHELGDEVGTIADLRIALLTNGAYRPPRREHPIESLVRMRREADRAAKAAKVRIEVVE